MSATLVDKNKSKSGELYSGGANNQGSINAGPSNSAMMMMAWMLMMRTFAEMRRSDRDNNEFAMRGMNAAVENACTEIMKKTYATIAQYVAKAAAAIVGAVITVVTLVKAGWDAKNNMKSAGEAEANQKKVETLSDDLGKATPRAEGLQVGEGDAPAYDASSSRACVYKEQVERGDRILLPPKPDGTIDTNQPDIPMKQAIIAEKAVPAATALKDHRMAAFEEAAKSPDVREAALARLNDRDRPQVKEYLENQALKHAKTANTETTKGSQIHQQAQSVGQVGSSVTTGLGTAVEAACQNFIGEAEAEQTKWGAGQQQFNNMVGQSRDDASTDSREAAEAMKNWLSASQNDRFQA